MKILSLGDLLLDAVILYDPLAGEADTSPDALQLWPGGSAANFAVWAARCGAQVQFVSRVGDDLPGEILARSLLRAGVTAHVRVAEGEATGKVLVMVDPAGVRRMWSYPGASARLDPADLSPGWFAGLDVFHLTGYSLLREGPRACALRALKLAHEAGTPFITLDPNPPHLIESHGPARYRELVGSLGFHALFPNLEEGALLSGEREPGLMAEALLELAPLVALKLGAEGCLIAERGKPLRAVGAFPVERVVDTTGAGDAFAAGFVVDYIAGGDPMRAALRASELAAQVVARGGAR